MYSKEKMDGYGIKEVPDVYLCDNDGNVLYFSDTTMLVTLTQIKENNWTGRIQSAVGNLENWFDISHNPNIKIIYFKSWKRSKDTGEDIPYGIAIKNPVFYNANITLKPDSNPFAFPITFTFKINDLKLVSGENCPELIKNWDENGTCHKTWYKPQKTYDELHKEEVKEKIEELKKRRRVYHEGE